MEAGVIKVEKRDQLGTVASRRLRTRGLIPAVLYGHKEDPVHLALEASQLARLLEVGTRMVDLKVDGGVEKALIKEVQYGPLGRHILHVDFSRVALDERVTVSVPLVLFGTPAGVKEGGVVEHVLKEVEVECLATNIPSEIKVNVNALQIQDSLLVKDLQVPEGVVCQEDPEAMVVTVSEPMEEEEEEAAPPEEAPAQPEVISEKEREERQKLEAEEEPESKS